MTARGDMRAAGPRLLELLTMAEAAAALPGPRHSTGYVKRLADAGDLERVRLGALVRITPESVAAYKQRLRDRAATARGAA
jgi:hypothetical protein